MKEFVLPRKKSWTSTEKMSYNNNLFKAKCILSQSEQIVWTNLNFLKVSGKYTGLSL